MILILNFFLFFSLEINDGKITKNPNMFGIGKDATGITLWFLGFGIMILMVYLFILQSWIMCILQDKRKDKWYTQSYKDGPIKSVIKLVYYIWKNTEETLHSRNMWCYIVCIGFSLGGLLNDFFWFAFTMTYLVIFSPQIMEVTRAVWMPRKRIVSTVILSTIILYWFAIIGYVYFGKDFDEVVKGSNLNMRRTLIVIFDSWYKFGLGGFLADNGRPAIQDEEENYSIRESRIAFDFLFFFIVPTLLLSIISGIIIDNFVERRANSDTIAERQNDQCFICGRKANEIADFSQHTKFEHNIWDYMFYIGYLKSMKAEDLQDYTDIHVRKCLDDENNDWFPAYQDFVLEKHQLALKAKKEKRLMHSGLSSNDANNDD
uniref:Ion transport domain-containing protein n=1 Tax=Euplotes crassus TaxID=5936 RepID=A0A7S3NWX7_EUPCR|mmetsp:Transcript_25806/g.25622  ORF Transcript_25806/g.25622 Transcript_25806/m.25622 type:complete len:375 (+) Transcript_25806:519-1643(+)